MEGKGLPQCPVIKRKNQKMARQASQDQAIQAGDKILLFNSRVRLFSHGKLHSKWEGPYLVLHITDHSAVTLQCNDGDIFKENGQRLKLFLEPNPQDFEEVDVLDFLEL
jgi:hypothetical protein